MQGMEAEFHPLLTLALHGDISDGLSDLRAKMVDSATAIRDGVISMIVNVTSQK